MAAGWRKGFSLLELLIVLVIIGLIAGVGYASLRGMMERSRLDVATAQVANGLLRARSYAQTKNVAAGWKKLSDTSYQLDLGGEVKQYRLPGGIRFSGLPNGTEVVYSAPYGEVSVNGSAVGALKITLTNNKSLSAEIHVVGVTGKVIRR
ncbi:prepilin-type N-terminal cleavage/methylation domain-containing protein [Oceanithermus sp.]